MRLRLKVAHLLMRVENLSTGIEACASGESLNSGDPAVHPAARHKPFGFLRIHPFKFVFCIHRKHRTT